jgi:hypothetical protein
MPHRRRPAPPANSPPPRRVNFRRRYDELEIRRAELMARLGMLSEAARQHPGYKRALKLLNDLFRKSSLLQRIGILQAASWLIDILEQLPFIT